MSVSKSTASSPPTPAYIFRGHIAAVHALHFYHGNRFFVSGDSEGWIVIWQLTTRRPIAAWKGHDGGIMGIKDWEGARLITHGRDHKLRVWQVREEDMRGMSSRLPADGAENGSGSQPWLVHSMDVNALNFCAFSICINQERPAIATTELFKPLLLAAPNGLDSGGIDIFELPAEQRVSKLQSDKQTNSGMVMALKMIYNEQQRLTLVIGYEDGQVAVYVKKDQNIMPVWIWERMSLSRPHTQPVLSLDITPGREHFITSSADANIAKFAIPNHKVEQHEAEKVTNTKHAGQQDLKIRSDGRVFATAGWDKNVRVYSAKTLKELAMLQWHQQGCYAIAFADVGSPAMPEAHNAVIAEVNAMTRMKQERDAKVHNTHWLVAGSKDGKISLWDIY